MQIDIKEISKIKAEPGDVIVFELGLAYSRPMLNQINSTLVDMFPHNEVLVAPHKMIHDIKIVKPEEKN